MIKEAVRARFAEHGIVALAYPTTFQPAPKIGDPGDVVWDGRPVLQVQAIGDGVRSLHPVAGIPD